MKLLSSLLLVAASATLVAPVQSQVLFEQTEIGDGITTTYREVGNNVCSYSISYEDVQLIVVGNSLNSDQTYSVHLGLLESETYNPLLSRRPGPLVQEYWPLLSIASEAVSQLCNP